jgi:small subunit ribosomal protein S20
MPNLKAAKKDLRQSKKRQERNELTYTKLRDLMRQTRKSADAKDVKKTEELVKSAIKTLDKAVKKGFMKKNTVSRRKSILARRLNETKKA